MTKTKKKEKKSFLLTLRGLIGNTKSFLLTLRGLIVALTTLLVAILGLIQLIPKFSGLFPSPEKPEHEIEVYCPETVPYYMKNFMNIQNNLYWFKVNIRNRSDRILNASIFFNVRQGQAKANPNSVDYSIFPGRNDSRFVDPDFNFLKKDINSPLEVKLKIRDDKQRILWQDTKTIKVLKNNLFDWDLDSADSKQISKEFLLASLSAWTLTSDSAIDELIKKLSKDFNFNNRPDTIANQWISLCYKKLFDNKPIFQIKGGSKSVSLKGEQTIGTPAHVLKKRSGKPIETALLYSTLCFTTFKKLGIQLLLFIIPESNDHRVFLSWSTSLSNFNAIDLSRNMPSFEINTEQSTSILTQFLKTHQTVVDSLKNTGVYVSEKLSIFALDFAIAIDKYSISTLP